MKKLSMVVLAGVLTLALAGAAYSHQGWGGRPRSFGPGCWSADDVRGQWYGEGYGRRYDRGSRHMGFDNDAPCVNDGSGGRGRGSFMTAYGGIKTADEAKAAVEKHLEYRGNPNLKVGKATDKDGNFEVEIVTKDGSLVNKLIVEKESGRFFPAYR